MINEHDPEDIKAAYRRESALSQAAVPVAPVENPRPAFDSKTRLHLEALVQATIEPQPKLIV